MTKYLVLLTVLLSMGCSQLQMPIKLNVSPTPDTILSGLAMLQDTAIEANTRKELSDNSTRLIVKFVVDSAKVIKTAPATTNWKIIVGMSLTQLLKDLPVTDASKFGTIFSMIQGVVK